MKSRVEPAGLEIDHKDNGNPRPPFLFRVPITKDEIETFLCLLFLQVRTVCPVVTVTSPKVSAAKSKGDIARLPER